MEEITIDTFYFELQGCHHYVFLGRGHFAIEEENLYMEYSNNPNLLERTMESVSKDRRGRNSIKSNPDIKNFRVPSDIVLELEEAIGAENRYEVLRSLRKINQYREDENQN